MAEKKDNKAIETTPEEMVSVENVSAENVSEETAPEEEKPAEKVPIKKAFTFFMARIIPHSEFHHTSKITSGISGSQPSGDSFSDVHLLIEKRDTERHKRLLRERLRSEAPPRTARR